MWIVFLLSKVFKGILGEERGDPLKPFHRLTNGLWPLKTIETNGSTTQKPLKNHWCQWSEHQKTFNGDGFTKNHWSFQWSLQNQWRIRCSLQKLQFLVVTNTNLNYNFSVLICRELDIRCFDLSRVEFTYFMLHWIFETIVDHCHFKNHWKTIEVNAQLVKAH